MSGPRLRAIVVLMLMAVALAGAAVWRPTQRLAETRPRVDLEKIFPVQFSGWVLDTRGPVQLVSPDQQALLNKIYSQTLSRTYVGPKGQRIMLSVAYGGDQSDATRAHRPEVCYPAQGFSVLDSKETAINLGQQSLPVRRLQARLGSRAEPITYWIVVGETPVISGMQQKMAQLRYGAKGIVPDGMLVRVSSIDNEAELAFGYQAGFVRDLALAIDAGVRAQIVGRAGPAS